MVVRKFVKNLPVGSAFGFTRGDKGSTNVPGGKDSVISFAGVKLIPVTVTAIRVFIGSFITGAFTVPTAIDGLGFTVNGKLPTRLLLSFAIKRYSLGGIDVTKGVPLCNLAVTLKFPLASGMGEVCRLQKASKMTSR